MNEERHLRPPLNPLLRRPRRVAVFTNNKFANSTAYAVLLLFSYALGYLSAPFFNSKQYYSPPPPPTLINVQTTVAAAASHNDDDHYRFATRCADPVPSNLVRRTILQTLFNGTSPYHNFPPAHARDLLIRPKRVKGWGSNGAVFQNLIRKVQPKTIIEVGTFLGASAIHMADLASGLGLQAQILCIDDFRGWPGFRNRSFGDIKMVNGDVLLLYQFMQNVVNANATESILFVPFSSGSALEKLCEWGVFGDLIEVDAGHDFHSAWSDINRAYKILRPGGVIFGHDYFTSADNKGVRRAVKLFARVNGLRVQLDGQHWVIQAA